MKVVATCTTSNPILALKKLCKMRFGKKITVLISSIFPTVFHTTKTLDINRYYTYVIDKLQKLGCLKYDVKS